MYTKHYCKTLEKIVAFLVLLVFIAITPLYAQINQESNEYLEYSGVVVDASSGSPLVFATLSVNATNISTITNSDGEFSLKILKNMKDAVVTISYLGYQQKEIPALEFKSENNSIKLKNSTVTLSEVNLILPKDAKTLVKAALKKKADNYVNKQVLMTAFYRETIKKRKKNASLAEAIVKIHKQPYASIKKDNIELFKARKSTNYKKLDTVALKLQGGPYNPLYIDLMKYPDYIFTKDMIDSYSFSFAPSTTINDKIIFVVKFKQLDHIKEPLYYGKLFIDAETSALTSAIYNLNVENKILSSQLFVRKKPKDILVYPINAAYRVDYREKDGKWYYGYGNVHLTFKIKRKRKWFNSTYSLTSEMAVTNWEVNTNKERLKNKDRLKKSIIISDETTGFSDPEFWGAYNVIEPEKSIESAIDKIKRQLKKAERG